MIKGSAVVAAESMEGKINKGYCLKTDNTIEIINHFGANNPFSILMAGFNLGYQEGQKAEKARCRNAK